MEVAKTETNRPAGYNMAPNTPPFRAPTRCTMTPMKSPGINVHKTIKITEVSNFHTIFDIHSVAHIA